MAHPASPLLDIAMASVKDYTEGLSVREYNEIREMFERYINGQIDYAPIAETIQAKCGTASSVEKIRDILTVSEVPLPPVSACTQDLGMRKKTQQWTQLEDTRLLAALHRYGMDNWNVVAQFVGRGRTRSQCSQRWQRGLDPKISRSHWSKEEEEKLLMLVEKLGDRSWIRIANQMGNRSDVQCRYRYLQMKKESQDEGGKVKVVASEPARPVITEATPIASRDNPLSFDLAIQFDFDEHHALFGNLGALFD